MEIRWARHAASVDLDPCERFLYELTLQYFNFPVTFTQVPVEQGGDLLFAEMRRGPTNFSKFKRVIFFSGEAVHWHPYMNFKLPENAMAIITSDPEKVISNPERFLWWPFAVWNSPERFQGLLEGSKNFDQNFACCVVSSNLGPENPRTKLLVELANPKHGLPKIHQGGKLALPGMEMRTLPSNLTHYSKETVDFFRQYTFAFVFENCQEAGYVTEKISRAFEAGCIPIYFGSDYALKIFNPESFIYLSGMDDVPRVVERIKHLMNTPEEIKRMRSLPIFNEKYFTAKYLHTFLQKNRLFESILGNFTMRLKRESHSQLGQDLLVMRLMDYRPGVFIDIGAYDGDKLSNSFMLEKRGWTGICIEPNPEMFQKLSKIRQSFNVHAAIYKENKDEIVLLKPEASSGGDPTVDMLAGIPEEMDPRHLERLRKSGTLKSFKVPARTLDSVYEEFRRKFTRPRIWIPQPEEIDYISIDVEGAELAILESIDFDKIRTKIWTIENNFPGSEAHKKMTEILTKAGYVPLPSWTYPCELVYIDPLFFKK